jgi:hypothetical protein
MIGREASFFFFEDPPVSLTPNFSREEEGNGGQVLVF